jgi:hypothetical protein
MVIMASIKAQIKIFEGDKNPPKVNIQKIISGIIYENVKYSVKNKDIILDIVLPTKQVFLELKRRLSAKRNRPNTIVEVLSYEEVEARDENK